ncbi:MAG: hypothetical protein BWK79_12725 [Beggiatoa sp. IS2]|nr:MAG: hypothetical protein BWK79_12725 [Beggiatoa sp. IS2]
MNTLILFFVISLCVGFWWFNTQRSREVAKIVCQRACGQFQLQLLDDTITLVRMRPKRTRYGIWIIQRVYHFEFYDGRDQRLQGVLMMHGLTVEMLELPGDLGRTISLV